MAWTRSYASRSTGGNDDAAAKEPDHRDSGPGPPGDQQRLVESSRYRHHPHAAYQAAASWTRAAAGLQDQDEAAPRSASEGGLASPPSRPGRGAELPLLPFSALRARQFDDRAAHVDPPAAVDLDEVVLVATRRLAQVAGRSGHRQHVGLGVRALAIPLDHDVGRVMPHEDPARLERLGEAGDPLLPGEGAHELAEVEPAALGEEGAELAPASAVDRKTVAGEELPDGVTV